MSSSTRKPLGRILKDMGVVHEGQIQQALHHQRQHGGQIGGILVQLGAITERDLAQALGRQAGLDFLPEAELVPTPEAISRVDAATATAMEILPLRIEGRTLVIAITDPINVGVCQDLQFLVGMEVRPVLADAGRIRALLSEHFGKVRSSLHDAIEEARQAKGSAEDLAKSAPVVRLLNSILFQAVRDKASDIHFEHFEGLFRIRYRVDGALYEIESPPAHLASALVSRVKVMANLDIAETRVPQDGRIELSVDSRPVDLRISTLPTMYGESVVMRVLDRSVVALELANLGLREDERTEIERILSLPHGIVLITGPTGSGKTTTLYAMLAEANDPGVKIITTEDPVEYDLDGIVQIPINEEIGVTYARVLRTILRQDPDKILVGEIRDRETAQVAVEASLTGHVVFSTLHTNDAPSAITRLVDIGVEPFLIAATLDAVIAQRLVRRICSECRAEYTPDVAIVRDLGADPEVLGDVKFSFGKGCDACHHTGYRGRLALFEMVRITERLREMIVDAVSTRDIARVAREQGTRNLRESGLLAVCDGLTTVEEVLRETLDVG